MKIIYEETKYFKFAFEFKYEQSIIEFCRDVRDSVGWKKFTYTAGKWRFNDPSIIFVIQTNYPDVIISPEIEDGIRKEEERREELKRQELEAFRIKSATTSQLVIPGIKGELRDYQKLGVEFFMNNGGRGLLADQMGSGKSIQSLAYLVKSQKKRSLVVCPASVKFSWKGEVKRWTNLKSFVVDSKTKFSDIPHDVNIIIINYDILLKFKNSLLKTHFDAMVVDECQLIKSPRATRSKMVKLLSKNIKNTIFLSGTPLLSRPVELFNMLTMIDPETWNDYYGFCERYCDGHQGRFGYEAKGATNLDELQQKIYKYFLRRRKEDVLKELPKKNIMPTEVDIDDVSRQAYRLASQNLLKYLKDKKCKNDEEAEKTMRAEKLVKINLLREISSFGKIKAAKEIIESIIDSGEKVLVFSSFNSPLVELHEEFQDSCLILGSTPVEERGELVKRFQEDPNVKVFFGGYKSAGVGITLTAANNVVLLDLPWNPADREQAIDRAHRIGSTAEFINIYDLTTEGTLDDSMWDLLQRKQSISDQVIDGKSVENENGAIEELIKFVEQQNLKSN